MEDITNEDKEQLTIEEQEEAEGIGIKRYAFNSFKIERSIRDILNWVEKKKIKIPEFQRDFVWNYNQSCKLIESILLGLPIPDFFMFRILEEDTEKYILIDGLQRYTTIKQYVEGYYEQGTIKKRFKINDKSSTWYNLSYDKLDTKDQDFFQDYSLKINVFDSVETSENMQKLYMTSIFERINTGSTKLSNQEVRNAIYSGEVIKQLKEDCHDFNFSILLQEDRKKYSQRCKDEEFYLRLLVYYYVYRRLVNHCDLYIDGEKERLSSSKEVMLCNYLFYSNNKRIDYKTQSDNLKNILSQIVSFNEKAFCTVKRDEDEISTKVHELFSEALVIALLEGNKINVTKEKFDESKIKIWKNQDDFQEFFVSTTSLDNVLKRVETMKKLLNGEL